jgi:hypothetical protein
MSMSSKFNNFVTLADKFSRDTLSLIKLTKK